MLALVNHVVNFRALHLTFLRKSGLFFLLGWTLVVSTLFLFTSFGTQEIVVEDVTKPWPGSKRSPNIVFILTDDQDLILDGMSTMPKTLSLLANGGMTFTNAFVTNPVCCPSRASILTGMYPHNTKVYNNSRRPGNGGCTPFNFLSFIEHYSYNRFLNKMDYKPIDDPLERIKRLGPNWEATYDLEVPIDRGHLFRNTSFDDQLYTHSKASQQKQDTLAVEYMTFHSGKYHNEYCCYGPPGRGHFFFYPFFSFFFYVRFFFSKKIKKMYICIYVRMKGWDVWRGQNKNSKFYFYQIIDENWKEEGYGNNPDEYMTDRMKTWSLEFLEKYQRFKVEYTTNTKTLEKVAPFLMVLSVPAPHNPFEPAPRHVDASERLPSAPRTANFGRCSVASEDKHVPIRGAPCLSEVQTAEIDSCFRGRLGTLMSVDELIYDIHEYIDKQMGLLNDTYFIFTSDNGYHLGQNSLMYEKRQPYETDIRVPFYIKGPGIRPNSTYDGIVLNIDIAPTLIDLARGFVPPHVDGQSLVPVLFASQDSDRANPRTMDERFLVEYYGESFENPPHLGIQTSNGEHPAFTHTPADTWNNTYKCIREIERSKGDVLGKIYCQFTCFDKDKNPSPCLKNTPEAKGEYFHLDKDPWQLQNQWHTLSSKHILKYSKLISEFSTCRNTAQCNHFRYGRVDP
ncbi:N-acetylglucosamine-6-sulfatase precursor [Reticulomyxa filosa]|uniref:N-acetylglucosamine-6-sulfatase n=1 Tax=Reticulomyxa filosa TaxID=46433 RepID=X6NR15_RETFI|nr:N-acetylglucosamine-6-sulfatase precursor [Reticulomyxa filosa]|eukprot:ETO28750.1 N-acetylglucosamine-6-sulfatase precursor [Reticulomyxa filosa]